MKIYGKQIRTVDFKNNKLELIDQNKLPFEVDILKLDKLSDVVHAIKVMQVRGAPAIGATGSFGLVIALQELDKNNWIQGLNNAYESLLASRPTAVDLKNCLDEAISSITEVTEYDKALEIITETAIEIANRSADSCHKIGEYGAQLINDGDSILTHCNAGALATVDFGTALAPMRIAFEQGTKFSVFVDETRPRLQGSRLTAFELHQEGIPYKLIVDNAAGHYMQQGKISMVITGADRIALNGDAANKIGTYTKAVLAKEHGIPFYIAAPATTFDLETKSGKDIPIEERDGDEILKVGSVYVTLPEIETANPAFDVTPAKYITGYITEYGVFSIDRLSELQEILAKRKSN